MIGDFTLLHGNNKKMNIASAGAISIFSSDSLLFIEIKKNQCLKPSSSPSCDVEAIARVATKHKLDMSIFTYDWELPSSVIYVSGQGTSEIRFIVPYVDDNVDLEIKCTATYGERDFELSKNETFSSVVVDDLSISNVVEVGRYECIYGESPFGTTCEASILYEVIHNDNGLDTSYFWEVVGGNIAIRGSNTLKRCEIYENASGQTSGILRVFISDQFSSDRYDIPVLINRTEYIIPKLEAIIKYAGTGACTYDGVIDTECTVSSQYMARLNSGTSVNSYSWSIESGNAIITSGNGTNIVTVQTTGSSDETFVLKCVASDDYHTTELSETLTHVHTTGLVLNDIDMSSPSGCTYWSDESGCSIDTQHTVSFSGEYGSTNFTWEVVSGGATIISGIDTDTVTIRTVGSSNETYRLKCTVSDLISSSEIEKDFTHTRGMSKRIICSDISLISGDTWCSHDGSTSCVVKTAHKVDISSHPSDSVSIQWSVVEGNATIVGPNDQESVQIQTDSLVDEYIRISVSVTGDDMQVVKDSYFTHMHGQNISPIDVTDITVTNTVVVP